ncbi:hypothetical protein IB265_33035 [Ensifer sp. ENS10]|uniref:hypothetical protein n=1 Tax=Ensifer sp. ENS10 TaxID=2769286 RepID=UPI0017841DA9|nr:hypothetical protein [Ensifer sp. ENS10]MBD9511583.1 hypothetical protein [Ensifer sp. ENS10]
MIEKSPWSQVKLDPELVPFIVLSAADVSQLTELALHAEDPVTWLTEELHKRGKRRKDIKEAYRATRTRDDAKRISSPWLWPQSTLPVKSQPWITEKSGHARFGRIKKSDLLTVITEEGTEEVFGTIEQLVELWSVD